MNPVRYRLDLSYDGTRFAGWQVQPNHRTVQGDLEAALKKLSGGSTIRVESSGRTDAGVHARAQVAHFDWPAKPLRPDQMLLGINAHLEDDARVWKVKTVPPDFHARFGAMGKEYRYFIHNAPVLSPCHRLYRTWIREPLDVGTMREAALILEGRHDFAAFAANPNREIDGTVRTLHELAVTKQGPCMVIRARGDGFLYKMVRSLSGFLIRVGRGEVRSDFAQTILASKVRTARVPTAPPEGLFLWRVFYGQGGKP